MKPPWRVYALMSDGSSVVLSPEVLVVDEDVQRHVYQLKTLPSERVPEIGHWPLDEIKDRWRALAKGH